ncbi:unnamed protein product, partial [Coregonus sp. 'balchen']
MAYVYPLPASLRRPLVRLVFQFMWGGRLKHIARVCMLCPIGEGGRGVPHFPLKLDSIFRNPEVEVARVGLDHRHLYEEVRQGRCPGPVVGIPAGVWEGVQVRGLDNGLKDLNWLSLHKCLPVHSIMYGRASLNGGCGKLGRKWKGQGEKGCGGDSEEGGAEFEGDNEERGEEVGAACCSGEVEGGLGHQESSMEGEGEKIERLASNEL